MKKSVFLFKLMLIFAFFSAIFLPLNFYNVVKINAQEKVDTNFTNLIVFARFNGEDEFIDEYCNGTTTVKQLIDNSYSNADYSVKDYYYRVSNGKINIQNVYIFSGGGSLMLTHNRGYYFEKNDSNPDGYEDAEYNMRVNELQQDWTQAVQTALDSGNQITNLDGSTTYSFSDLDKNGDGKIDSITVIYKYSNEYDGTWKGCLWNYQSYTNRLELTADSTTITSNAYLQISYDYKYSYINQNGALRFANLKTMIHEMGHIFGLKDLYNTQSASPVYYMSSMAKAISPIPQYISSKEREVLGWLNENNVKKINEAGQYTIDVTSSEVHSGIVCYKCDVPSINKTLYLEYRKFDGTINKYDTLSKVVYDSNDTEMKNIKIKSGLVCYLLDKDTLYPNNMYCNSSNWNYQVLGGQYQTKTDSALAENDSLYVTTNLLVEVVSLNDNTLTFKITGTDIAEHSHSLNKVEFKDSTCQSLGNIEYYKCTDCEKYFLSDGTEITYQDTIIELKNHTPIIINGKPATCTETGLTDGQKCEVCGKILKEQTLLGKLAHVESDWIVDKEATMLEQGQKHKECVNCKQVLTTEIISIVEEPISPDIPNPDVPDTPAPDNPQKEQSNNVTLIVVLVVAGALSVLVTVTLIFPKIKHKKRKM